MRLPAGARPLPEIVHRHLESLKFSYMIGPSLSLEILFSLKGENMDQELDQEMDDFKKEMAENRPRRRADKRTRRPRYPARLNPEGRYLVLCALGVFVLVIIFVLFSGGGDEFPKGEFDLLKGKLGDLERRMTKLEGAGQKIARLEGQIKRLERSISKREKTLAPGSKKKRYHEVRRGETLSRIAQKYGITVEELCRVNRITPKTVIRPGQKLLVPPRG